MFLHSKAARVTSKTHNQTQTVTFIYNISSFIDMNENAKQNLRLLKALGEETRYKIVEVLLNGETCACEIPSLIKRTQPNTSMQLAKLKEMGILKSRREGKKIIYSIQDQRVAGIFKTLDKPEKQNIK